MSLNILIIDDEEQLRRLLTRIISLEGFRVFEAGTLRAGLSLLAHEQIDVVLCDVKLPDGNGVDFVAHVKSAHPLAEIILITAFGNIGDGVRAMKNGAFDYLEKANDNDRIIPLLYQAGQKAVASREKAVQVNEKGSQEFKSIIGTGTAIAEATRLAGKAAASEINVLLLGETGTGKEVFANAIHYQSKRADRALVALNCSAFSKELLEGELFGHKAGAYTGAVKDKKGLIEIADGGTLFLDEIGEMHIELQAKLLRVLEQGEFYRLGDTKKITVDIRLIAATNRQLTDEIAAGRFREDLYYRLNVFSIVLPPLRDRPEDIPLLANHFLQQVSEKEHKPLFSIENSAMNLLKGYSFKGNIRELKNILQRAAVLADGGVIKVTDLPFGVQKSNGESSLSLESIEKEHISRILASTGGNKAKAARVLQIGLATLYRKMQEYGI
ncbi:MAG: sigma-54-dependent Fis family transcriptional regulator [Chitinophagaceae bacterium]|nr:MAG: sigma-54-dependent Fis family transcriptional regulator [Chitinophagaceae bacterium]